MVAGPTKTISVRLNAEAAALLEERASKRQTSLNRAVHDCIIEAAAADAQRHREFAADVIDRYPTVMKRLA